MENYKTKKILTTKRSRNKGVEYYGNGIKKQRHKELKREARRLYSKKSLVHHDTIDEIRFELKFIENGAYIFQEPLFDLQGRQIKGVSGKFIYFKDREKIFLNLAETDDLLLILSILEK